MFGDSFEIGYCSLYPCYSLRAIAPLDLSDFASSMCSRIAFSREVICLLNSSKVVRDSFLRMPSIHPGPGIHVLLLRDLQYVLTKSAMFLGIKTIFFVERLPRAGYCAPKSSRRSLAYTDPLVRVTWLVPEMRETPANADLRLAKFFHIVASR